MSASRQRPSARPAQQVRDVVTSDPTLNAVMTAVKVFLAEMFGTYLFVLAIIIGTVVYSPLIGGILGGLAYVGLHAAAKRVSGGHFNPAVSIIFYVLGYLPSGYTVAGAVLLLIYLGAQFLGGFVAAWTFALVSSSLAPTVPTNLISGFWEVVVFEFLFSTAFFVVVLCTEKPTTRSMSMDNSAVYQGLFLSAAIAVLADLGTGGSLNLARTLGPGIVSGETARLGAYFVAQLLAIIAALVLYWVFRQDCNNGGWTALALGIASDAHSWNDGTCHHDRCEKHKEHHCPMCSQK